MNKLILLGNGFDLAHGMKTSYNDFILWYLEGCFDHALKNIDYEDELFTIKANIRSLVTDSFTVSSVKDFIYQHYCKGTLDQLMNVNSSEFTFSFITSNDVDYGYDRRPKVPFEVEVKSALLKQMILNCSINKWVDIENLFYSALKKALEEKNQNKQKDIIELNHSLAYLINQLQSYLSTLNCPHLIPDYSSLIQKHVDRDDILINRVVRSSANRGSIHPRTMVLNFNYTSTIEQYLPKEKKVEINYIHGKLNDDSNPIIFGFGDELDAEYTNFELDTATKGIFKYIKSFWYFKTSNYHNLLRFIQSNNFQVHVLGHSCGLSDRTMLNMIFEHENCASIKIHYYNFPDGSGHNYTELTEEISRHFKNKQQMRLKIVPFDRSKPMPQLKRLKVEEDTLENQ